jgi:hypothetical protein
LEMVERVLLPPVLIQGDRVLLEIPLVLWVLPGQEVVEEQNVVVQEVVEDPLLATLAHLVLMEYPVSRALEVRAAMAC